MSLLTLLGRRRGMRYLLREEFLDTVAAGAVNGTFSTDGKLRTAYDTTSKQSVSGGSLVRTGGTGAGDPAVRWTAITRKVGRAMLLGVKSIASGNCWVGWCNTLTMPNRAVQNGFYTAGAVLNMTGSASELEAGGSGTITLPADALMILRAAGAYMFVKDASGTGWVLVGVGFTDTTTPLYPAINGQSDVASYDYARVFDIPGVTEWGYATAYSATPAANDLALGNAIGWTEIKWTPASNEVLEIDVRRIDDNNRVIVRCSQAGSTILVGSVDAGVETDSATAAQTWSVGTTYRIAVQHVDGVVRTYVGPTNKNNVTVSTALINNTGVKVRGFTSASNLATWRRTGFGAGKYPVLPAATFTLLSPSPYQTFQRSGSTGSINVQAILPTAAASLVEYQWNGGAWTSLGTIAGGWIDTVITGLAQGQGTFFLRCASQVLSSAYVGIGDIFIIAGQSNNSNRATNAQVYTHATLKATMFGNDYTWKELVDPVDSSAGQVDTVSSDNGSWQGSYFPLVATSYMANQGVPCAFVPCAQGGTTALQWQPGANHADRTTLYGSMKYRAAKQAGCKAILWWLGETDADAGQATAAHQTYLEAIVAALATDLPGVKFFPNVLELSNGHYSDANAALIQTAINNVIGGAHPNVAAGADFSAMRPATAGEYHFVTNAEMTTVSGLVWNAIKAAFGW